MADQTQTNEIGAIWIKSDKNDKTFLSIQIGDKHFQGFTPTEKKTDKSPDYNIIKFNADGTSDLVGAAWKGLTKNDRQKLTIKMNDGVFYTAVMRDGQDDQPEDSNRAQMTVFGS